ncbi:MAG: hypothetical protein JJ863_08170 [Deltaproteobacteria bacterium]|nr:hypothetical protein [Deltaproteobacteria bacterium]
MSDERPTGMLRWVIAIAVAQAGALLLSALFGHLSSGFGEPSPALAIAGILGAGLLEGALIGAAQAWAVGFGGEARWRWIGLTTLAFGLWWAAGIVASLFEPAEPSRMMVVVVALVAGGGLGLIVGGLQAGRRPPSKRAAWVGANVAGWAAGLLLAALAAELVPAGPNTTLVFVIHALGGAATGTVVGLTTGPWRPEVT